MLDATAAANLVRRAFDAARNSGKEDWHRMTVPVLKNRILLITGGHFREAEFGASSFRSFLSRLPDGLVTLDESRKPATVELATADVTHRGDRRSFYPRIRPDLWRAVLDYSSGRRYVWDASSGLARPATAADHAPSLPTITPIQFAEWAARFRWCRQTLLPPTDGCIEVELPLL